jgi:hypothetical protein
VNDLGFNVIQAFGSLATTVGVFLAWRELRRSERQALTDFEDGFSREYRELSQTLPVKALLGEPLVDKEAEEARPSFFRYFDLCNEQVFLRQNKRISKEAWSSWCSGIESNLKMSAFNSAWVSIKSKTQSFAELKRLEASGFRDDPVSWGRVHMEEKHVAPEIGGVNAVTIQLPVGGARIGSSVALVQQH